MYPVLVLILSPMRETTHDVYIIYVLATAHVKTYSTFEWTKLEMTKNNISDDCSPTAINHKCTHNISSPLKRSCVG